MIALSHSFPWNGPLDTPFKGWRISGSKEFDPGTIAHLQRKYHAIFLKAVHPEIGSSISTRWLWAPEEPVIWSIDGHACQLLKAELLMFHGAVALLTTYFQCSDADLEVLGLVSSRLKDLTTIVSTGGQDRQLDRSLADLLLVRAGEPVELSGHGPNSRVFLNVIMEGGMLDGTQWDQQLFSLATGMPSNAGPAAPSPHMIQRELNEHGIHLFDNWRALALQDTFTRVAIEAPDPHNVWEKEYLRIYQYVLLLRAYCLVIGSQLDRSDTADIGLLEVRDRWHAFLNDVDLHSISYKWLPDELYRAMVHGTRVDHEVTRVNERLDRAVMRFRERRAANLQKVGLVLTILLLVMIFFIWRYPF